MSDNDRQLLSMARKGDIDAFEKLTENYQKKVYNIILNRFEDRHEVKELTQEVFVRIFKSLKDLENENLLAFSIYKTTKDVCGF